MKVLGITGGVGSGKSEVLDYLESRYGAYVCQMDEVAKRLEKRGEICFRKIVDRFGEAVVGTDGELDRKKLGEIVFSDEVDGATSSQIFRKITLPLLRPILIYVMITSLIGGMQMFDVPQILTNGTGDPMRSTMTLIMFLNKHLFSKNYGMGGALSVFLFIITGILSMIVFRFNKATDGR